MTSWRSACSSLQRFDILLAAEQRALQLCEGQLFKLMEGSLEDRDAAEKVLSSLSRATAPPDNAAALPLCVDAHPHSLPSAVRRHLHWIIRGLLLLREPQLLAWLLSLRATTALGPSSSAFNNRSRSCSSCSP